MDFRKLRSIYLWAVIFCAIGIGIVGIYNFTRAKIVIEWSTASELDTVGFNIYKSESTITIPTLVNPKPIPASPDPLTGGIFSYTDKEVTPGVNYYYYLEDIDTSGKTSRVGPIEAHASKGGVIELIAVACLIAIAMTIYLAMRSVNPEHNHEPDNAESL